MEPEDITPKNVTLESEFQFSCFDGDSAKSPVTIYNNAKEELKNEDTENVETVDEKADTAVKTGKFSIKKKQDAFKRWLGIYELQETLGKGGSCLVETGYDPDSKQRVAIKMKKPSLSKNG